MLKTAWFLRTPSRARSAWSRKGIKAKVLEDRVQTLDVMEIVDRVAK